MLFALCAFALFAQERQTTKPPQQKPPGTQEPGPLPQQKTAATPEEETPLRFDVSAMDKTADPCADFFQYACGNWMKKNPIPADQSRWSRSSNSGSGIVKCSGTFSKRPLSPIRGRDAITGRSATTTWLHGREGDRGRGLKPLQPELNRIAALKEKASSRRRSPICTARASAPCSISARPRTSRIPAQSSHSSTRAASVFRTAIITSRTIRIERDPPQVRRTRAEMFELVGESGHGRGCRHSHAHRDGAGKASLDRVPRRDPDMVYHKMTEQELTALGPAFQWNVYFRDTGAPEFTSINVSWPDFVKTVNAEIQSASLADWKTYLRWHPLHSSAPLLPAAFVNENFNFYGKTLTGATELRPRWKRCVDLTDRQLGEALGHKFVDRTFGAEGKERTLKMVDALEKALGEDIENLTWMTPATKQQALDQAKAITNKIGYPDKWRDYSSVAIAARRSTRQRDRARHVRISARAEQDRQAGRPHGMGA